MIRYFSTHPTAANLLMLFLIVLGLMALPTLRRETFPDFASQEVEVRVLYPGASAADVEEALCQRLEDAIDGVSESDEVRCEAREGIAILVARMQEGGNVVRFLDDIKTEVEAITTFPEQVETPVIKQLGRTDQVVSLAVTGPMTVSDLKAYCEQLKERLQQLAVVSQVTVQGFSQHQLRVQLSAQALRQYGLSLSDVARAISNQSIDLPAGSLETREQEVLVRFTDQRRTPRELADLIIVGAANSGGEVRLGEMATITDQFELDEDVTLFDGQRAGVLQITKTKSEDTLTVVDAVRTFVARERQVAPPGVAFVLTQDVASIVRDRLQLLLRNGWQGLCLVFLVMGAFFRWRLAFWVAAGLPVSFLGGLFGMAMIGYSINMITMVALLIALGLLMDDAIVITENIATHLSQGRSVMQAAIEGTSEVAPGVVASFLTTVAVFGPLAFLQGDIGKVLQLIPVVLILVLAVSLVEAFLILPHHLAHTMQHGHARPPSRMRQGFERAFQWCQEHLLGRTVELVIDWRYAFIGLVIAVFLGSIGMIAGGFLKFRAFPDIESDIIEARILLPQGTPLWRTQAVVERVTAALTRVNEAFSPQQPQRQSLVRHVSVRFNYNPDAHETGAHVATVTADLLTAEVRHGRLDDILHLWRRETGPVPDVLSLNFKEPQIGPGGLPIDIRLSGSDLARLKSASLDLQAWLRRYRGVLDLTDDLRPGKPELRLRLREGTLALGLNAATIASQLRAALQGTTASEIQVGPEAYDIDVRLQAPDQDSLEDLEDFRLFTSTGQQVPLSAVTHIQAERGYGRIHRIDGQRTVTIQGDVETRVANVNDLLSDTRSRFLPEFSQRYPTVQVALEGQNQEMAATSASLQRGFLMGLIGIFILLSFQFHSYIEPLTVMTAIPLAMIGVIWGHLVMGLELSMPSMMGAFSLAGVVVNDSILLVEFLKLRARSGMSITDAAKRASRERFRAVLLTSLTTIAGLLPLLAEKSLQAQVLIPLATSIVFGLSASTLLVLLVVPALFSILDDLGWTSLEK